MEAPAEPKAVKGTATASGEEKPKTGTKMKSSLPASQGRTPTPGRASDGLLVNRMIRVQMTRTPGMMSRPTLTPEAPPSRRGFTIILGGRASSVNYHCTRLDYTE